MSYDTQDAQQQGASTLKDSHGAAKAGLGMAVDAMTKLHGAVSKQAGAHADLVAQIAGMGQGQGGGQDQSPEQAIWSAFPSTDPAFIHHLASKAGGDPHQLMTLFGQQADQDAQKFHAEQLQNIQAVLGGLAAPSGPPTAPQAAPPPGALGA